MKRIYLDNAATSWPKPEAVYKAMDHFQREIGAAAGRGAYQSAQQAQKIVAETRAACARLLGANSPQQIVFTANGTAALNLAIHGLLRSGDHVVTTVCEHNSVLRPLHHQVANNDVQVSYVGCDATGLVDPAELALAIQHNTKLIAITHASNVTGTLQAVEEITRIAHQSGVLVLLDAAQTAGCMPIDVNTLDVDLLACGGHKGLLGPLGTGLLYIRPGLERRLSPPIQGGTGINSQEATQPEELPQKFETGNLNVPALAGLGAAVNSIFEETIEEIQRHHQRLTSRLIDGLARIPSIKVYGPTGKQPRVGVVSCSIEGYDPQEFAMALDASSGIECRAGLHCAPRMHHALGTDQLGGLVRFSPGLTTNSLDIKNVLVAIEALANNPIH